MDKSSFYQVLLNQSSTDFARFLIIWPIVIFFLVNSKWKLVFCCDTASESKESPDNQDFWEASSLLVS